MSYLLAEAYLHALDPFAIQFTERFGLRWYGLSYAAGFLISWGIIRWMARSGRTPLQPDAVGDFVFYLIAGALLGGRIGYAAFYDPALFVGFSGSFPFWSLLAINQGGMASHGGVLGVIVACWLFGRRRRMSALHLLDMSAFSCTPGLCLGRLANFVNGELWGRSLPPERQTDPPWWSIKYPEEILVWSSDHPADAERLAQLEPLRSVAGGDSTFLPALVEAARAGNEQVVLVLKPLLTAFYPSQIFQAITDGPLLIAGLALVWLTPRKPGVVGCWFLIGYGLLRILTEQFRQPDAGVALLLGLSRGQALSVLMIVGGAIVLWTCARRPVEPLGGLLRPKKGGV